MLSSGLGKTTGRALAVGALLSAVLAGGALAQFPDTERAAWLLQRDGLESLALTGQRFAQGEFEGGGGAVQPQLEDDVHGGASGALPVLASLVLPGAGEALLGYKRGYLMMALDIFAWTQVSKYHGDGGDLRDEYYAYADQHYSDVLLLAAYVEGGTDIDGFYRAGIGNEYYNFDPIADLSDLQNMSLYVSVEDDRREYYENLGKWDQFVFGWDDFRRPDDPPAGIDFTPTGSAKTDLGQPWISAHREIYREMRIKSNDAFKKRDRWLYANIGLRIVSVLQTAYLQGFLGGGPAKKLEVAGHEVRFRAQPVGLYRGAVSASVSF